ncbi:NAD(+) diphosphatase [Rhizobium sp. SSA_523]|uniref:NAD(+) diphosphatase n=1 Tax=Rhizobium sp. SSA_523 TaxID=2952477 RepID=UPI002090D6C6|nr:NAD(+) diphosphatase [Rhizobium sp. SSA_523]MCO5732904.1 NAD(+) diphosphatase [Rhizobium sp. SSA_523]WKC23480.1 NAD(+) diphosphatase [Rhizobium sp. SSA_523]
MSISLFETDAPHPEASRLTAFAGNRLNRDAEHRAEDCLEQAVAHESAHAFAFAGGRLVLKHDDHVLDALFARHELAGLHPDRDSLILLGYRPNGEPRLAVSLDAPIERLEAQFKITDARSAFRDGLLDEETLGEVAQGLSLMHWNSAHRFCGKCGTKTESRLGGYKRQCPQCGHMMFPRTDPVVIMLTVDVEQDRVLLGRGHHFAPGMYSTLAGFVEPGETIEDAVRRETLEESGIEIGRVRYHASQPWPMPHSLMIGCFAEALSSEIRRDEQELADCRWFSRAEMIAILDADTTGEGPFAPPPGAIAHRLMRDWVDWPRPAAEAG